MKQNYQKPEMTKIDTMDVGVVLGSAPSPAPCGGGTPCVPMPGLSRASARPLVLDAKGNPVIFEK